MNIDVRNLKKELEPIEKLALHDDADGITSAVLLSYALKIKRVWAPEDFGEWDIKPTIIDGKEEPPPTACVDMVPANPEWNGFCIDHHPGHVSEELRKYRLIHGDTPTSIIVYELFKDMIPREQAWKVVVGAVGDGQPELVPPEVWASNPILLEDAISTWERYGKIETSSYPLYMRLSSGLNAACKLPEKWYIAYATLRNAKSPWDLINDSSLKAAKEHIDDERRRIINDTTPILMRNGIILWSFTSDAKMERTIAWEMWEKERKTTIALNTKTGRGSIRGTLATLIYQHLQKHGYKASGHPGFGGLRLREGQTLDTIYRVLLDLKI